MTHALQLALHRPSIALAAAALALGGCASTPEAAPERDTEAKRFISHPGAATLYVYRADFSSLDGDDPVLYVDNRLIGATLSGTFFRIDVRPGAHVLRGYAHDNGSLRMEIRSGELYFVSLNVISGQSQFGRVESETGRRELVRCCVLLENWAPGQRPLLR